MNDTHPPRMHALHEARHLPLQVASAVRHWFLQPLLGHAAVHVSRVVAHDDAQTLAVSTQVCDAQPPSFA